MNGCNGFVHAALDGPSATAHTPGSWSRRSFIAGGGALLALSSAPAGAAETVTIRTHVASRRGMLVTSHVLLGRREAVLVDCGFLIDEARAIADMVAGSGRTLSRVIVTHDHPDHYLGASTIRSRFPDARFLARADTLARIARSYVAGPNAMTRDYGTGVSMSPMNFTALEGDALEIERATVSLLDFTGGESPAQLAVHLPERREIIASDLLSNRTHPYFGDRDLAGWRRNLDRLSGLRTRFARPGHGEPGPSGPMIASCLRYADVFEREAARAGGADALIAAMRRNYPDWAGERLLGFSAAAQFENRG